MKSVVKVVIGVSGISPETSKFLKQTFAIIFLEGNNGSVWVCKSINSRARTGDST